MTRGWRLHGALACILGASGWLACSEDAGDAGLYTANAESASASGESAGTNASDSTATSSSTGDDQGSSTTEESTSTGTDSSDTGPLLDVGGDTTATAEGGENGCAKVDFLFVVDNSGSMSEEQANLATSFPGFIDAIQGTLMAQDYHIMVTDTDSVSAGASSVIIGGGTVSCETHPNCCIGICNGLGGTVIFPPPTTCNGEPCTNFPIPDGCEATLGAGRNYDQAGDSCNIANDATYMLDTQPDQPSSSLPKKHVEFGGVPGWYILCICRELMFYAISPT